MEAKFKVGDRVRVLDCPVMPDAIGKSGIIRHTQGDLYRVEVDGKVIPDYALEADIELIRTQSPWISVTDSLPEVDTLPTWRGDPVEEIIPDCSLICQIEFQEIIDRQVERVLKGEISINDVA